MTKTSTKRVKSYRVLIFRGDSKSPMLIVERKTLIAAIDKTNDIVAAYQAEDKKLGLVTSTFAFDVYRIYSDGSSKLL